MVDGASVENAPDLDELIERYHSALDAFMTGNPEPAVAFFSRRDDVTSADPFGPVARGPNQVKLAADRAAMNYRGGRAIGFETITKYVTPELAYLVEVERYEAKVGGRDDLDPITTVQAPESVLPTKMGLG